MFIATSTSAGVTNLEVVPPTVTALAVRANGAGGVGEGTGNKAPEFRLGWLTARAARQPDRHQD